MRRNLDNAARLAFLSVTALAHPPRSVSGEVGISVSGHYYLSAGALAFPVTSITGPSRSMSGECRVSVHRNFDLYAARAALSVSQFAIPTVR